MRNSVSASANQAADPILAEHAAEIRRLGNRLKTDIIEVGRRLKDAQARAGHGRWLKWLEDELGWSISTAERFIAVYEFSQTEEFKFVNLTNLTLPMSAIYLLAAPSTPEVAKTEIIERAKAGKKVSVAEVKRTIKTAKARKPPAERTEFRAMYRAAKLGDDTIDKLKGTSLASAREQDDLVRLNRGAPEGEHTPTVKRLIADAVAGKNVSAVELVNNGVIAPYNRSDGIGPGSSGEGIDVDTPMLGILLKAWDRAPEPVRQKFMARVGLIPNPLTISS